MPWVILIIVIAYCFIWVLAPRKMWRITHGWQYKNPEANEPSDAAYAMLRIRAIVPIVIIPVAIFGIISAHNKAAEDQEKRERAQKSAEDVQRDMMRTSEFARQARKAFGVPDSEVVIRYPAARSLKEESPDKIKNGLAPVGWLPYDNERSEPRFLKYLHGTGLKAPWGRRYQLGESTDLVAQLPFSWSSDCGPTVYAVTETETEIRVSVSSASEEKLETPTPRSCQMDSNIALLDVNLQNPVGNRRVLGPDGIEIPQIKI